MAANDLSLEPDADEASETLESHLKRGKDSLGERSARALQEKARVSQKKQRKLRQQKEKEQRQVAAPAQLPCKRFRYWACAEHQKRASRVLVRRKA
jgi:hypothetical protein